MKRIGSLHRRHPVAHLGPADLDRADPGLDLPLGCMAVAHDTPAALRVHELGMGGEERLNLGLDRLHQHAPGALAQHRQQRVVGERWLLAWAAGRTLSSSMAYPSW